MTALALITGLVAVSNGITYLATYRALTLRYDLATYDRQRLEATRLREIEEIAIERVHEARVQYKAQVGDLLDTVAERDQTIETLTIQSPPMTDVQVEAVRRYQLDYGAHR